MQARVGGDETLNVEIGLLAANEHDAVTALDGVFVGSASVRNPIRGPAEYAPVILAGAVGIRILAATLTEMILTLGKSFNLDTRHNPVKCSEVETASDVGLRVLEPSKAEYEVTRDLDPSELETLILRLLRPQAG